MELIKSFSEIMSYDLNPLKHIELVARNCYKSEDKITDESCNTFIKMLKDKKHMAMLEFYPFYFRLDTEYSHRLLSINNFSDVDGDLMLCNFPHEPFTQASCNLRTAMMISKYDGHLSGAIYKQYPQLSFLFDTILDVRPKDSKIYLVNKIALTTSLHYLTARFICDRGVSHEVVRHRKCSFAQESTRYCNYGKDEHIKFIIPTGLELDKFIYDFTDSSINSNNVKSHWLQSMLQSEYHYRLLLTLGQTPQQARSVLPNSLKTEIIVQARLSEWKHIFEQRCSKTAHPDMQELMIPFKNKICNLNNEYSIYFNN